MNKYFVATSSSLWSFDDGGGGAGSNWYDAETAGNPVAKPVDTDTVSIVASCQCDETTNVLNTPVGIAASLTLDIETGVTLTCSDLSHDGTGSTLNIKGTGHLSIVSGSYVTAANSTLSSDGTGAGTLTISQNLVTGTNLNIDLKGQNAANHFTILGNGNYISIVRANYYLLLARFRYVTFTNIGSLGLNVNSASLDVRDCLFNGSGARYISLNACNGSRIRIENNSFAAQAGTGNFAITVGSCQDIILRDNYIYGQGKVIQVSGSGVKYIGGAIGFKPDGTEDARSGASLSAISGGKLILVAPAVSITGQDMGMTDAASIHFIGSKTSAGAGSGFNAPDWSVHEKYFLSTKIVEEEGTPGKTLMDQDDHAKLAPKDYNPNVIGGWIRVKGGNTPSVSINVDFQSSGLNTSATLLLDVGGAISGTEASDTSASDTDTLTATLSGALPGTDEHYIEWMLKLTDNANTAVCHVSNFTVANTGVNDIDMSFGPYPDGSWPGVLAAVGGGGVIGGPNKRGGKQ